MILWKTHRLHHADAPRGSNVEKCLNCQFYDRRNARPTDGKAIMWGQCRRHSPQHLNPATAKSYHVEGVWPLVRDDDWCGEWRSPTRTSLVRSRFGVRPGDLMTPVSLTPAAPQEHPEEESTVAGDD